jgi:hypothetical protein
MRTIDSITVSELTAKHVVVNGETIEFDEPFDETPDMTDFSRWLANIKKVLEKNVAEDGRNKPKVQSKPE